MRMFKTAAIALTSISMVAAPVTASAAGTARAASAVGGESELEGNSSWIIGLLGLLAGIGAIILVADNDEDSPVSP